MIYKTLLLCLVLTGCSGGTPDWYRHQGFNSTECGPTAAVMAVMWAGGDTDRQTARRHFQNPRWWHMSHIKKFIQHNQVDTDFVAVRKPARDELGIYFTDNIHYVVVERSSHSNSKVDIYDPMGAALRRTEKWSEFEKRISADYFIRVKRDEPEFILASTESTIVP